MSMKSIKNTLKDIKEIGDDLLEDPQAHPETLIPAQIVGLLHEMGDYTDCSWFHEAGNRLQEETFPDEA